MLFAGLGWIKRRGRWYQALIWGPRKIHVKIHVLKNSNARRSRSTTSGSEDSHGQRDTISVCMKYLTNDRGDQWYHEMTGSLLKACTTDLVYIYIYGQWHVNWKLHVVETWGCFVIFSFLWHTKFRITGTILLRSSNQSSDQLLTHTQPQEFLHPLMWTCRQKGSAFLRVWRGEWFFKTEAFKWRMLQVF